MTSFLNKKSSLVLLILSFMVIAVSISSASAEDIFTNSTIDASFDNGGQNTGNITQWGDNLVINGTYNKTTWNDTTTPGVIDNLKNSTGNGRISVYLLDDINATKELNYRFIGTINVTNGTFNYTLNTGLSKILGPLSIYLVDEDVNETIVNGANSSFDPENGVLEAFLKTKLDTFVVNGVNVRLGQQATFTVTVKGQNATNTASIIGLENVTVIVTLPDNSTINVTTDENGTGNFTWLVSQMNFEIFAQTDLAASNVSYVNWSGVVGSFSYDTFYNDTNGSWAFTAAKGQSNVTQVWFDSPWGYIIGQQAIIFWNIEGVIVDYNKTVTLFYFDKGSLQRTERVPAFVANNYTNVSGYWVTNFTQAHDELVVVVVFPEDTEYLRSEARNSTFVDPSNDSRRTTIEVNYPIGGLRVGQQSDIEIRVKDFQGNYVQSGQITLLWDGLWNFSTDLVNGVAFFTHTYTQAGAARDLTINFLGDTIGNRASTYTTTVPVGKGVVDIVVTQNPLNPFVGEQVIVGAAIQNIAIGESPMYVTFNFVENGVVLHTSEQIAIDKVTDSSGLAQYAYTYILPHTALTINAVFTGNDNYNAATGTLTNIIVNPAPTA